MSVLEMSAFEIIDNIDEFDYDSFIKSDMEKMDKIEICKYKYNFYKIDYKFNEEIMKKHVRYGDYDLLELKFDEIIKKIFKFPKGTYEDEEEEDDCEDEFINNISYEKRHNSYLEEFQTINKDVLDYIKNYVAKHGYPPTVREIGKAINVSSPATVQAHLNHLANKGYIRKENTKNRTIELLQWFN